MSKYLIKASYSADGIKGVMATGGSARVAAIEKMVTGVGGSVEAVYFAFGGDDILLIVDAPNNAAVAAVAGTVGATGAISKYETVVLLTASEMDDAANMSVAYTPPGG
jgi:uncharacterized protein with GYD domain